MNKTILILFLLLTANILNAQTKEQIAQENKKYSNNIGFIQGSQKEKLKKQFPMCDEFLDIHWFKKQPNKLQRGWRKYTYFKYKYDEQLKKYVETKKKITIYELVEIQQDGHTEYYGIYFIKRAFPQTWKQVVQDMTITGNNKQYTFHYKSKKYIASEFKFNMANSYLNVCVAIPDNQTALFYEMKRANKVLDDETQDRLVQKINNDGIKFVKKALEDFVPMDVNYDGVVDLFFQYWPSVIYSYKQTYYESHREKYGIPEMKYVFPPKNVTCTVTLYNSFFYIRKQSLFFQDMSYRKQITTCNLTQLTTQ